MTGNLILNLYKKHQGLSFKACVSSLELLYIVYECAVDKSSDKALLVTLKTVFFYVRFPRILSEIQSTERINIQDRYRRIQTGV